jgi:predicted nucleic acid-binding protein
MRLGPDWYLENSRTALWQRPHIPIKGFVIDPTIVVALAFFEHLRTGIIEAAGTTPLVAPASIETDLVHLGADAVRSGLLDFAEAYDLAAFFKALPVRHISASPGLTIELRADRGVSARHAPYVAVAREYACTVMTYDVRLTRLCRRLHVPRLRYAAGHKIHWWSHSNAPSPNR